MQNNTEAVQKLRMQCFSRGSAGIKGIVRYAMMLFWLYCYMYIIVLYFHIEYNYIICLSVIVMLIIYWMYTHIMYLRSGEIS